MLALVGDDKLQIQIRSLDAQIAGLQAQLAQGQADLTRAETLARTGAVSRQQLDQARTTVDVANSALAARTAERGVVVQQVSEGAVLAPRAGRILQVPVTKGSVVLPGDAIASVAEADYVLRLSLPERHAAFVHLNDKVRLDGADLGRDRAGVRHRGAGVSADPGRPRHGRCVRARRRSLLRRPAHPGLGAGRRTDKLSSSPARLIHTRFGLSYVDRRDAGGSDSEIPVQRGRDTPTPDMPDGVEILSGLRSGDVLVAP